MKEISLIWEYDQNKPILTENEQNKLILNVGRAK